MTSLGQHKNNKVSVTVPWLAVLTSVPVWAHIVFGFGNAWVVVTLTAQLPTYLSRILHFDLKKSGITSAVPFLFSPIGGIFFGYMGQKVRFSGYLSPLNSLHLFNTICGVLAPVIFFMITLVGCDATATIVLLCCSQFASSAFAGGSLINNIDLASNFAGTISGISITFISLAGIVSPLIVGSLTNDNNNGEFDWDEEVQGYILGSTGYGFIATHIIGAYISEKIGSKYVFGLGILFTGIFSTLCPVFARWDVGAFIALRVMIGLVSGVVGPAFQGLIARWYPLEERHFITSVILASLPLSTVTSMSSSGYLAEAKGWAFAFYLFGGLSAIWFIPWLFLAYDSPDKHPRISEGEKNLIMTSLGHHKGKNVCNITTIVYIMKGLFSK